MEDYYFAADLLERLCKGQEPVHAAVDIREDLGLEN
jgi:RHH-type rel operon transcriptional repressor/antitoxin RelB